MKFKKVAGFWNPQEEKEIIGKIIYIQEKGGKFDTKVYILETEEKIIGVFGSAVLDEKIKSICQIGNTIKIIFLGMKQGRESTYKDFDIYLGENSND